MLNNFKELIPQMQEVKEDNKDFLEYLVKNCHVVRSAGIDFKYETAMRIYDAYSEDCLAAVLDGTSKDTVDYIYKRYDIISTLITTANLLSLEIDKEDYTSENYDLVKSSGLDNYLYMATGAAYLNILTICDRITGINNMSILAQLNSVFAQNPSIDDFNASIDKMEKVLSKEKIAGNLKFLKDIERFNDPNLAKIIDNIDSIEEKGKKIKEE